MSKKLIDKSLKMPRYKGIRPVDREEVDLALKHLDGKITLRQYGAAFDRPEPGFAQGRILTVLRQALALGWISIIKRK